MKKLSVYIQIVILCIGLAACGGSNSPTTQPPIIEEETPNPNTKIDPEKVRLRPGLSCTALASYITDAITQGYLQGNYYYATIFLSPPVASIADDLSISRTNLQETGVDESDIVKTDAFGNMFIADGNRVLIASAYPATDLSTRTVLQFDENAYIEGLILDEQKQRLIITFSPYYNIPSDGGIANSFILPPQSIGGTVIKFIDIADLDQPVEIRELRLSGSIQETRYTNEQLLLLMREELLDYNQRAASFDSNPQIIDLTAQYQQATQDNNEQLAAQIETQLREVVASIVAQYGVDNFLPSQTELNGNNQPVEMNTLECEDIFVPQISVKLGLATLHRIDADGTLLEGLSAVMSYSEAYFSDSSVFLYQRSNDWWWDNFQADESAIHQISYSESLLEYVAMGVIPGTINNRFSLSEREGYLRVASNETTRGSDFETVSIKNHMNVLQADANGALNIVGSTQTYAEGERIFSARFVGDRGYVVTFRQVDPLFTFDLSQPTAPSLQGELEIPGFSEYIHPVGEDRLITVGQNGNSLGVLPGVRFQLFDVSDLNNPTLLHSFVPTAANGDLAYAWSAASYDHHAFTYVDSADLLVVPLQIANNTTIDQDFSGFIVLEVSDGDGFTELGRIDHEDIVSSDPCLTAGAFNLSGCISWHRYSWVQPRRSVIISDADQTVVYSLSNVGLKASPANDPSTTISSLSFVTN